MDWPEATTTGIRSGSGPGPVIGARGSSEGSGDRVLRGASYHRHPTPVSAPAPVPDRHGVERWGRCPPGHSQRRTAAPVTCRACPTASSSGWPPPGSRSRAGFNGPGQPANNWLAWEQVGRVEPSGDAVGFWDRPEEALDRAAATGLQQLPPGGGVGPGVSPTSGGVDASALAALRGRRSRGCLERGLEPLVTLHHFTHPAWLGDDLWLRPDAPERYRAWVEVAVEALAPWVRLWVTVNEINVLAIGSWLLGMFPPGRSLAFEDAAIATDHLLTAHVRGLRRHPPGPPRRRGDHQQQLHERVRLRSHAHRRAAGPQRGRRAVPRSDDWLEERAREHDALLPPSGLTERVVRRLGAVTAPYRSRRRPRRRGANRASVHRRQPVPRRAVDAVYDSPHERTLDVLGLDWYDPTVSRHFRLPGHRTAGGRNLSPPASCGTTSPIPPALTGWLRCPARPGPGTPVVGGRERAVQPGARRSLPAPSRRMGPAPLPPGASGRGHGRRRRRRPGDGLLALVAGRQLRVGVLRAPLRPLRDRSAPGEAREGAGWTPTPSGTTRPAPTAASSPVCGPVTARCCRAALNRSAPAGGVSPPPPRPTGPGRARPGRPSGARCWPPASASGWRPPPGPPG